MKKHIKKVCATVLSMTLLMSMIPPLTSNAKETDNDTFSTKNPFVKISDENGVHFYGATGDINCEIPKSDNVIKTKEDYYNIANQGTSSVKPLIKLAPLPPSQADNSQTKYFPEIGNQGALGTCGLWSGVYYQFSYEMNRQRGTQASAETTYSPNWSYNLVNNGQDSGTMYEDVYQLLQSHGAVPLSMIPYNDTDYHNWYPEESIWREAIRSRLDSYYVFDELGEENTQITSPDDTDLLAVKTALSNGDILTYSTYIYSWNMGNLKTNPEAPENNKYNGEYALTNLTNAQGAHRMTLVGYNDNIWTDINGNDKVDSGEMGAFKIANSWGDSYCNKGFAWVAYDALNEVSCVEGMSSEKRSRALEDIVRISVKPYDNCSDLYLKFTLNTSDRTQTQLHITGEKNGTEKTYKFLNNISYTSDSNKFSYNGTTNSDDGTFVLSLDTIHPEITVENFHEFNWSVTFTDTTSDSVATIVKNAVIVNEATNKTYTPANTFPFTLNGNSKSLELSQATVKNKVIYYIGYDNPTLHYKKGNGTWQSVKMTENLERHGSMYKYVIENTTDTISLYFSDENGNKDTNNGKYFTANEKLNYYRTKNVREPLTVSGFKFQFDPIDINQRTFFIVDAKGGYEPYNYQYTIENLDTGDIKIYDYNYPSEKSHAFYKTGNYRITTEVLDYAGDVASFTKEMTVNDLAVEFDSLKLNTTKPLVGNNINFEAITKYESIISYGGMYSKYEFVITDSSGNICHSEIKRSDKFNMSIRSSTIHLDWIPPKADTYTIKVSTTDGSKNYAEKTLSFTVNNKTIGDADGDGRIKIKDATTIQQYLVSSKENFEIFTDLADCDLNNSINIKDATLIQMYLVSYENTGNVGNIVEYTPPVTEPITTAPTTEPTTTQPVTEPTTVPVEKNIVTFTNSFNWGGTISCYYWSDSNHSMTTWPGKGMNSIGNNDFGQTMYTFEVPNDATYIIFTNGSSQTTDIPYSGGKVRYYPLSTTDSNGHNNVATW